MPQLKGSQTTIDMALEGIKNAKPISTQQFDFMAAFINQISDDVLRERLEEALERIMPQQDEEIEEP